MAIVLVRHGLEQSEEVNQKMTDPTWQWDEVGMLAGWRGE